VTATRTGLKVLDGHMHLLTAETPPLIDSQAARRRALEILESK